jgi:hypothetical protein
MSGEIARTEWAVRVRLTVNGVPGTRILECFDQHIAQRRLEWWRANRPETRPELVSRRVVVTMHEWQ